MELETADASEAGRTQRLEALFQFIFRLAHPKHGHRIRQQLLPLTDNVIIRGGEDDLLLDAMACYALPVKSWRVAFCVSLLLLSLHSGGAGTLAQFRTVFGNIEVELYDQQKPATVRNFKRLVQRGAYRDTFFHRVVPGFVAQGGGFFTTIRFSNNDFAAPWSHLGQVQSFGSITNEFDVGPRFSNTNGAIAMAKADGNPNSATCQWFFNLGNNSTNLDNQNRGFTVFGRLVRDTGSTNWFIREVCAWVGSGLDGRPLEGSGRDL